MAFQQVPFLFKLSRCRNHVLQVSLFDVQTCWGLADPRGTEPPRASQFLYMKDSFAFPMQTNQFRAHSSSHLLYRPLYSPVLITPRPCVRLLGTVPMPQSPLMLFKLAKPKPCLFLLMETTIKALVHFFSSHPLPPDQTSCFPQWLCVALCASCFQGSVNIKNLFLSDNHFHVCVFYFI